MAEHDDLIDAWLDGRLEESGRIRLAALLEQSAGARAAWWKAAQFATHARELCQQSAGARSAVRMRSVRRERRASSSWWRYALVAAAVVIAALLAWPRTTAVQGPTLASGDAQTAAGDVIALGRPLIGAWQTRNGAGLFWADGTQATLDAGGRMEVFADPLAAMRLEAGALEVIRENSRAQHFSIVTPHGTFSAIKARFRLNVSAAGSRLAVHAGEVIVKRRDLPDESISSGRSMEFGGDGLAWRIITVAADGQALPAGAVATLAEAMTQAVPGTRIELLPGIHRQGGDEQALATLSVRANRAQPVIITGDPTAEVVVTGWNGLVLDGASGIRIRGLRLRGEGTLGGNGIKLRRCHDVAISSCTIRSVGGSGINIEGGHTLTIEGCRIERCGGLSHFGQAGIDVDEIEASPDGSHPSLLMRRNLVADNRVGPENRLSAGSNIGGHGIAIRGSLTADQGDSSLPVVLAVNRITGNAGCGIWISGVQTGLLGNELQGNQAGPSMNGMADLLLDTDAPCLFIGNRVTSSPVRRAVTWSLSGVSPESDANRVDGGDGSEMPPGFAIGAPVLDHDDPRIRPWLIDAPPSP